MHPADHVRRADVGVPGHRVGIFPHFFFFEHVQHPAPQIVIVIQQPDFRRRVGALQQRAQMIAHELNFVFLAPDARRHAPVLVGVQFVLRRYRLHRHALRRIRLQEFQEILRVAGQIKFPHRTAQHRIVGLHPARRRPRRRQQKYFRIFFSRLANHRQNVFAVVLDRKPFQIRIGFPVVVAVQLGRVIARAHAHPAKIQSHFRRVEHFVQQLPPYSRRQLVEHVARRVGERAAESLNLLKFRSQIQLNLIRTRRTR